MRVDSEKLAAQCMQAAGIFGLVCTFVYWGEWLTVFFCWIMTIPFALILSLLVGTVLHYMGAEVTKQNLWLDEKSINVVERSVDIIGRFDGNDMHEWIVIKRPDNGELVKLLYDRHVNLEKEEFTPPDNRWFLLDTGGLLYVEPEKTAPIPPVA